MSKRECITAIVPVRNGAKFLSDFLPSIVKACSDDDEIIFIEDHSTDESLQILNEFSSKHRNTRVVISEKSGLVHALNKGINEASHSWLARFDCDDSYAVTRLDQQVAMIKPSVVCIFSDYRISAPGGQNLGLIPSPVDPIATKISLISNVRTPHPVALINKEAAIKVGGYIESDFPAEDLSLWLRLSAEGELVSVPEELLTYFLHTNSVTGTKYFQSKEKGRLMYSLGFISREDINSAILNFKRQRLRYNQISFSRERIFLHYLDIYSNMKALNYKFIEKICFLIPNFQTGYFISGYKLAKEARKRRIYRQVSHSTDFPVFPS